MDLIRALFHQHADRFLAAQTVTSYQRIVQVKSNLIVFTQGRGNTPLGVFGAGLVEVVFGKHKNVATASKVDRRPHPGNSPAENHKIHATVFPYYHGLLHHSHGYGGPQPLTLRFLQDEKFLIAAAAVHVRKPDSNPFGSAACPAKSLRLFGPNRVIRSFFAVGRLSLPAANIGLVRGVGVGKSKTFRGASGEAGSWMSSFEFILDESESGLLIVAALLPACYL
jgi:hypothetical protein